jgi:hypothetical protein
MAPMMKRCEVVCLIYLAIQVMHDVPERAARDVASFILGVETRAVASAA